MGSKILVLDHVNSATFSPTAAIQELRSDTLPSNPYAFIKAQYAININQIVTPVTQVLTFNITINGAIVKAYTLNTTATELDGTNFTLWAVANAKAGGVVKLELAAGSVGVDDDVDIIVNSVLIEGVN